MTAPYGGTGSPSNPDWAPVEGRPNPLPISRREAIIHSGRSELVNTSKTNSSLVRRIQRLIEDVESV